MFLKTSPFFFFIVAAALAISPAGCSCGDDDDDDDDAAAGDDDDDDLGGDDDLSGDDDVDAGCVDMGDGLFECGVEAGGVTRRYLLDAPDDATAELKPLVVAFHFAGSSPEGLRVATGLAAKGDEEGFFVAWPQGWENDEGSRRWTANACASDDQDFVRAMIEDIVTQFGVDEARIYATGGSNGASFTNTTGAANAGVFAAIAPVAGTLGAAEDCGAEAPQPVMLVHGLADETTDVERSREARDFWVELNGCTNTAQEFDCQRNTDCAGDAEVTLCELPGVEHVWPTGDFNATDEIWEFFAAHSL
ncbi:hypothetical protein K8I61_17430 [bacterium]|nr:hypothetical protein [bacterium]